MAIFTDPLGGARSWPLRADWLARSFLRLRRLNSGHWRSASARLDSGVQHRLLEPGLQCHPEEPPAFFIDTVGDRTIPEPIAEKNGHANERTEAERATDPGAKKRGKLPGLRRENRRIAQPGKCDQGQHHYYAD